MKFRVRRVGSLRRCGNAETTRDADRRKRRSRRRSQGKREQRGSHQRNRILGRLYGEVDENVPYARTRVSSNSVAHSRRTSRTCNARYDEGERPSEPSAEISTHRFLPGPKSRAPRRQNSSSRWTRSEDAPSSFALTCQRATGRETKYYDVCRRKTGSSAWFVPVASPRRGGYDVARAGGDIASNSTRSRARFRNAYAEITVSRATHVRRTVSFVFAVVVGTPCAIGDTSCTSSGARPETARRTSVAYSSNSTSSRRTRRRDRDARETTLGGTRRSRRSRRLSSSSKGTFQPDSRPRRSPSLASRRRVRRRRAAPRRRPSTTTSSRPETPRERRTRRRRRRHRRGAT